MIKLFLFLFSFLLGAITVLTPDIVSLYSDYVLNKYQKVACKDVSKDKCYFDAYYDTYKKENPQLVEWDHYFQMSHGPAFWILSKRCTNKTMHNVSALGDKSGTMTRRQYFWTQCGQFNIDISDLLFGDEESK